MISFPPGSVVRCRGREWVVMPAPNPDIILLRPLTGSEKQICGVYLPLAKAGMDRIEPAEFPLPTSDDTSDAIGTGLLWDAARLILRDGAGPLRSLGRISFRPRAYQFVPLLMAMRLNPVRLLIADDVGIGKTIEALLIARELMDRHEIDRLCVLCPPYLCDQWKEELWEKFGIEARVIRAGTVSALERDLPSGTCSVFGYYPHIVVSIDYAKSDRHKANFLCNCPKFVIVDEAHGAAKPPGQNRPKQQRYELLCELAEDSKRQMVLLTATPHSGIEESFLSLLGLLKPSLSKISLSSMSERERAELARHFVQRRRADVQRWLGEDTFFPKRVSNEIYYSVSPKYARLFKQVYRFSQELVRTGETLSGWKKRIRYWSALSLLRSVMSSPAAAMAALYRRAGGGAGKQRPEAGHDMMSEDFDEDIYAPYVYEFTDRESIDVSPSRVIEDSEEEIAESDRSRLRKFARMAKEIMGTDDDTKLLQCYTEVHRVLKQGYNPIIWCRYIATSDYVAAELQKRLAGEFSNLRIISVTGALSEDVRRAQIDSLRPYARKVLVATDCLSEGINLQEQFNAVLHYDLPWNPNRLEQREGRVDRFGQSRREVRAVLLYGRDNPVDGAVLDVLLRKAREIHRSLGISVPVPADSETVMEAVLKALFFRETYTSSASQLWLFEDPIVQDVHKRWDEATKREKESRTRFAQRSIKPEEVEREIKEADSVLGDPDAVRRFVLNACQRLGAYVRKTGKGRYVLENLSTLPEEVSKAVPHANSQMVVSFTTPLPEGAEYLGRNHPFVTALAQYLMETALEKGPEAPVTRCGVVKTRMVDRRTVVLLLRVRFLMQESKRPPVLCEEVLTCGFTGNPDKPAWLAQHKVQDLVESVKPEISLSSQERKEVLDEILSWWNLLQPRLASIISKRGIRLKESHIRVRAAAGLRRKVELTPQKPDLLGVLVLLPIPRGVR